MKVTRRIRANQDKVVNLISEPEVQSNPVHESVKLMRESKPTEKSEPPGSSNPEVRSVKITKKTKELLLKKSQETSYEM